MCAIPRASRKARHLDDDATKKTARRALRDNLRMSLDTTLLLVEDEPAILELLEFALSPKGYKLKRAMDAQTARDLIRDALPDLVILDWMMPGESGVQLARSLRSDPRTKGLPII